MDDNRHVDAVLARLAAFPDQVAAVIGGVAGAALRWKPDAGRFSLLENVCHLRDLEVHAYAARVRAMTDPEEPHFAPFDGTAFARGRRYNDESPDDALAEFRSARAANVAVLRAGYVDPARAGRFGGEPTTCGAVLAMMTAHDAEHLDEMRGLLSTAAPSHS
ncbi:MAG TPA: DinB family protein [Candidatus Elarobacter sp.]